MHHQSTSFLEEKRYPIKPISGVVSSEELSAECEKYACLEWPLNHLIKIEKSLVRLARSDRSAIIARSPRRSRSRGDTQSVHSGDRWCVK